MKRFRRRLQAVAAIAAAVIAATAVTVAPAGASLSGPPTPTYCNPAATPAVLDAASVVFAPAAGARGDDAREPSSSDVPAEVPASAQGKGGPNFKATIDVYVHVVTAGSTGAISNQAIQKQISVLNLDYAGLDGGSGVDTGFAFRLAGVDRTDNAAWFNAGPGTSDERAMKAALHKGDATDLNIYSTTAEAFLGWSYFPSQYKTKPEMDGIVIDWATFPGVSTAYAGRYDLGKTATHEAGHWLGLYHVFQGGCNNWGDYVDDTPPQLVATRGCPAGQDSCSEPGLDSIHNYMDYSYDSCYSEFTAGQAARMHDQWLYFRAGGGAPVGQ